MNYPFDKVCPDCGSEWKVIGGIYRNDTIAIEVMAAHDCEGIGVLATTKLVNEHYETNYIDTETAPHFTWEY